MKNRKRVRMALVLSIVAVVIFTLLIFGMTIAAPKSIAGVVRISHGWGGTRTADFEMMVKDFQAKYPGVKVDSLVVANTDQRHQQLLTAVAGGTPPEVGMLGRVALGQFITAGAVVPIDKFIASDKMNLNKIYYPSEVNTVKWKKKTYGLPVISGSNQHFLYWNKKLFREAGLDPEKPPTTWKELEEYAVKLTERDSKGEIQSIGIDMANAGRPVAENHWRAFIANNNGNIISSNGKKILFGSSRAVEALQYMLRVIEEQVGEGNYSWIQKNIGLTPGDYNVSFYRGKVAMIINGNWFPEMLRKEAPNVEWGISYVPYNSGNPKAKPIFEGVSGTVYCMMKGAKNPEAAWELMKSISMGESYRRFMIDQSQRPTTIPELNTSAKDIPGWPVFLQSMLNGRAMPLTPVTPQIMDVMKRYEEMVMMRTISPQEAVKKAAGEAQSILNNAKW